MPWYYIEAKHGNGHQCTTSEWFYREKPIPIKTSEDIENIVDDVFGFRDWGGDFGSSAIFRVKRVAKIPVAIRDNHRRNLRASIESAQQKLKALMFVKTHPPRCTAQTPRWPGDERLKHLLGQCTKAMGHRGKHDANSPLNREKFGR